MNLRIHFGVCGIGYGHASRAGILIKEFTNKGYSVSVSSYGEGLRYLKTLGLDVKYAPPISYGVLPEGKVSIKMTIFRNMFFPVKFMEQLACEFNYVEGADVVLSDSRGSTILAGKLLGKPVFTILNQFNIRIEYPRHRRLVELVEAIAQVPTQIWALSDEIFIADYPPPYTISKRNLVIPDKLLAKTCFIGPIIESISRSLSKKFLYEKYELDPNGNPVIFYHATGPSYERRVLTNLILPMLEELGRDYQVIATLGGDRPHQLIKRVKVYQWVENPLELFNVADLVICRAGQTTLAKALACGKPLIMIPIPAHAEQLGNARSVSDVGAGIMLDQRFLSIRSLKEAVRKIQSNESFYEKAKEYQRLAEKLNPIEHICSRVLNLAP